MPFQRYVEIEWNYIRLQVGDKQNQRHFCMDIATTCPATAIPPQERLLTAVEKQEIPDGGCILSPRHPTDKILFSDYLQQLLQIGFTLWDSDPKSSVSDSGNEQPAQVFTSLSGKAPGPLFPVLGSGTLLLHGLVSLLDSRDNCLGWASCPVYFGMSIPLDGCLILPLYKGDVCIGEIEVGVYVKPEMNTRLLSCHDVEIFPCSAKEISVYYSGELTKSKLVKMIWTLDSWSSNTLTPLKYWEPYWVGTIQIPKDSQPESLEVAFNNEEQWDNNSGNNWVFENFRWM